MATLTNPIEPQNIVDRFADYVVATGNDSIVWGTNAKPSMDTGPVSGVAQFVQIIPDASFGGSTAGKSIGITETAITPVGNKITATTIYNALVGETNRYTAIKNINAIGRVTGAGGNSGSRLRSTGQVAGRAYIEQLNATSKAHMASAYESDIGSPDNGGVASGQSVSVANLQTFFTTLRAAYADKRDTSSQVLVSVCHASCHSSCHRNRGRR